MAASRDEKRGLAVVAISVSSSALGNRGISTKVMEFSATDTVSTQTPR
jgi:hypothetical protein